jgi:D-allose transport system ATP-binding protein
MAAIYGAARRRSGVVTLNGKQLRIRRPYDAIKAGMAMVTEDRRGTGFFHNFSIRRNIAIGRQVKTSSLGGLGGVIDRTEERRLADEQVAAMNVRCRDIEQNIVELSGGNQQKVILGRLLAAGCDVIIFDEPTKGIDVGTKSAIYTLMRDLADAGTGVMVVSSELPEVMAVSDRIIVFAEGEITATFTAEEATEEKLVRAAALGHDKEMDH